MRFRYLLLAIAAFLSISALFASSLVVASAETERQNNPEGVSPSIQLEKTVGINGGTCATSDTISVAEGSQVWYCYQVTNVGSVTLTRHDLEDSELGTILNQFPYTLVPGASAFLTETTVITQATVNTATWTAYNPGPVDVATATDAATVTIQPPSIELEKTVGTNGGTCATSDAITVAEGAQVWYCYTVTNTGNVTLTRHDLEDSELGTILDGFPFTLVSGASAFITETTVISATTVNTATWTAYNPGPMSVASATDVATVTVEIPTAITLLAPTIKGPSYGSELWVSGAGLLLSLGSYAVWRRRRRSSRVE